MHIQSLLQHLSFNQGRAPSLPALLLLAPSQPQVAFQAAALLAFATTAYASLAGEGPVALLAAGLWMARTSQHITCLMRLKIGTVCLFLRPVCQSVVLGIQDRLSCQAMKSCMRLPLMYW